MPNRRHLINRSADQRDGYLAQFGSEARRTPPKFVHNDAGAHRWRIVEVTENGKMQDAAIGSSDELSVAVGNLLTGAKYAQGTATTVNVLIGGITVTELQAGSSTVKEVQEITFTEKAYGGNWLVNFSRAQIMTIQAVPNTASNQTIRVQTVADAGGTLNDKFFDYYNDDGLIRVWFNVNSAGVAPSDGGGTLVEVTLATNDDAQAVASGIAAGVIATAADTAVSGAVDVSITTTVPGVYAAPHAQNSGFTVTTTTAGTAGALDGTYFVIPDRFGTVAVVLNSSGTAASIPADAAAANRLITATLTPNANAAAVAAAINTAINADAEFVSSVSSEVVTVTDAVAGAREDFDQGTAGMPLAVTTIGASVTGSPKWNASAQELSDVFGTVATVEKGSDEFTWLVRFADTGSQSAITVTSFLDFPKEYEVTLAFNEAALTTAFAAAPTLTEIDATLEVQLYPDSGSPDTILQIPCKVARELIT